HEEARRLLVTPPAGEPHPGKRAAVARARLRLAVTLVHEAAADRARTAVEILVAAPHGEVGLRRMQSERRIADRMRQLEPGDAAGGVCRARDARDVERLTGAKLHPGPQHQRDLRAVAGQGGFYGLVGHGRVAPRP